MGVRTLASVLLLLPLAGCYADQKAQLAACEKTAAGSPSRALPGEPFKQIQACMAGAGYRFIGWNDGVVCDLASVVQGKSSLTSTGAECFEPKGWLALKIYRLEMPSRRPRTTG